MIDDDLDGDSGGPEFCRGAGAARIVDGMQNTPPEEDGPPNVPPRFTLGPKAWPELPGEDAEGAPPVSFRAGPTNLNELGRESYERACRKGFYEEPPSDLERLCLVHSEISEAAECARTDQPLIWFDGNKPEGMAAELADAVIRICDFAYARGIDLDRAIRIKSDYNETRPHRHGKKL